MFSLTSTPILLGPVADLATLQTNYPADTYPGSFGMVGAAPPYTPYISTGSAWVNYAISQFATSTQGGKAGTALQPAGSITSQTVVNDVSTSGVALLGSSSPKTTLAIGTSDLNLGATGSDLFKSSTALQFESVLGVDFSLTSTTYILGQNGFGSVGVTTQAEYTVPSYIQANGGYIYVDGCSAGGGGSGGSVDAGGGGGGAAVGVIFWPVFVPPGLSKLYIQVGGGGAGGASGGSGTSGGETSIRRDNSTGIQLLRLGKGQAATAPPGSGLGAAGGVNDNYIYSVGTCASSSSSGGAGGPTSTSYSGRDCISVRIRFSGGYGGAGAGATGASGGAGGLSAGPPSVGGTGAGAGGGGGTSPWGVVSGQPVYGDSGTPGSGGAGGASPTAGITCTAFGGGGGGGGKGFAGGAGGDGFLRIWA